MTTHTITMTESMSVSEIGHPGDSVDSSQPLTIVDTPSINLGLTTHEILNLTSTINVIAKYVLSISEVISISDIPTAFKPFSYNRSV